MLYTQRQDIVRYLKIKQMSMGDGHPENIPAARRVTGKPDRRAGVRPLRPKRPVLGGLINEYEWTA